MTPVYAGQYKFFCRYLEAFIRLLSDRSGVVEVDYFSAFPLLGYKLILVSSKIRLTLLYISTTPRSGFLPTPIRMTFSDLECPIPLSAISGRHA